MDSIDSIMKKFFILFAFLLAFSTTAAPLVGTPWTTTALPGVARAALGAPNTNWSLSDAQLANDTVVSDYITSAGVQKDEDRRAIALFVARLKRANIFNNLVDAGFLKTNQGALSGKTLLGRSFTSGGLSYTKFGAYFSSNSVAGTLSVPAAGYVQVSGLPDLRTCSMSVVCRIPGGGDAFTFPQTLIGAYDSTGLNAERIQADNYFASMMKKAGSESVQANAYWTELHGYLNRSAKRCSIVGTFTGNTVGGFYDAETVTMSSTTISSGFQPIVPLTVLQLGCDITQTNAFTGEIAAWTVFNKVLSSSEVDELERAYLALDSGVKRVFIGDSQTTLFTAERQTGIGSADLLYGTNSWPGLYMATKKEVVWYSMGISGSTTGAWLTGALATRVAQLKKILADEQVEWWIGPLTANNWFTTVNATTTLQDYVTLVDSFKGLGDIILTTQNSIGTNTAYFVTGGGNWNAAADFNNHIINTYWRAHPEKYTRLVDRALAIPQGSMNNTNLLGSLDSYTRDGTHMRMRGNQIVADLALGKSTVSASYDSYGAVKSCVSQGEVLTAKKIYYPGDMFSTLGTRQQNGATAVDDCWEFIGIAGNVTMFAPDWVTNATITVTTKFFSGYGASQSFYGIPYYYPRDGSSRVIADSTAASTPKTVTTVAQYNYLTFTFYWPLTNAVKSFTFRKDTATGFMDVTRITATFNGFMVPTDDTLYGNQF